MQKLYQSFLKSFAAAILLSLLPHLLLAQKTVEGVVRLKVSEALAQQLAAQNFSQKYPGEVVTGVASFDRLNKQFNVRKLTRVFPPAGKNEARHRKHGLHLWYEVRMDKTVPVSNIIQSYQSDKQILRAEAVYQKAIIGSGEKGFGPRVLKISANNSAALPDASDDPLLASQWHYNNTGQTNGTPGADIRLFGAWKVETGNPSVIVAVTDGGIQTDHPDLAPNMWVNPGEIAGNNLDDDDNGYVDDIHGYSFVTHSGTITPHEHGTHVAGTLAAVSNNAVGVAGIAGGSGNGDGVRLMSCAVFAADSVPDGFAEAYVYSADNGAVISQNSWGYTAPGVFEQVVLDAIDYFIDEAGKNATGQQTGPMDGGLAIFSAGNFNDEGNYYPAYYEPVIAVASTTHKDKRAYYSNYGSWIDISAPGGETDATDAEGVISTLPGGEYGSFMGTSMACPHVSGVAALITSRFGRAGFRPEALRARLLLSVDDIDGLNPMFTGKLGSGRLDASLALREGDNIPPQAVTDLAIANIDVGEITLTWTSPRDEGDFVAEYDLRYATSPITASTFTSAVKVEKLPSPKTPGASESFTITKLPGGTKFYFAIRSQDFEGNVSPLSNVVSETSALTPAIALIPDGITENLKTAQQSTRTFKVSNIGKGLLKFSIETNAEEDAFAMPAPLQGEVSPGGETTVVVSFDASGKLAGTYKQDLVIHSNDPERNTQTMALVLEVVNNGQPIASVQPEAVDFKSVQIGHTLRRKLQITNAGSDPLTIDGISSSTAAFQADAATPLTIAPLESLNINLSFSPTGIGAVTGEISFHTNDPDHVQLLVQVKGEGIQEAPITVSPDYFNETLARGAKVTRTLKITNNGSQDRTYRIQVMNSRLATRTSAAGSRSASGREKAGTEDSLRAMQLSRLQAHQEKFASRADHASELAMPLGASARTSKRNASAREKSTPSPGYERELRKYTTGFEDFSTGAVGEQHGWFATQGWNISEENPGGGGKHFRGASKVSGSGEKYCISPYLFEYEEFYYPQYTSATMRLNLDEARGTTWQVVPQDPWSYVATRIRFNADGTIDAMVIDNDYESHWKSVPAAIPSGYFDLAIEYNNAGSDTSGFPTYYLFINNQHVFSGTGLGSGIGQVAFVSPMETDGPVLDVDDLQIVGGELIPPFVKPGSNQGTIAGGQSATIDVEFDASIMKFGSYESDLVVFLDELDSLVVPVSVVVPGEAYVVRDLYSIYWVLEKNEEGRQEISLRNTGGEPVDFKFETDLPGMTLTPQSGSLQVREEEVIEIKYKGEPGIYEDEVIFTTSVSSEPEIIPVYITRLDSGAVFFAPGQVTVDIHAGEIATMNIQLRNDGINTVSFTTEFSPNLDSILTINPPKATIRQEPLDVVLTIDARELTPGRQDSWIEYHTNDGANRKVYTYITLNVLPSPGGGGILREVWRGISGKEISSIPVNTPPASTELLSTFESPSNTGDNYGARVRGYVQAPVSGQYTFWISSNDNSELWLSTDENPANKRRIASVTGYTNPRQWTKYPSQTSTRINLEANRKYYIEALHKEGVGTDHLSVGWQLPDGALERPIAGMRLIPYEENDCNASGTITRAYWTRIRGTHVSDIPLNRAPDGVEALTLFEGPANAGINYGARISGYICPPQTGEYRFWIASNDHSELWLSTDDTPANGRKIAQLTSATGAREWNKFASQRSDVVFLIKGKTYYIEALHKQGIGTDHIAVGWQLPDGSLERPIAGTRLSPAVAQAGIAAYAANAELPPSTMAEEPHVQAYPNPVKGDRLNISITAPSRTANAISEIVIRQLTGLSVYHERISCPEGCNAEINVHETLPPGIYILQVHSEGQTFTEKLIVE